jgi:hypothetical protein
MTKERKAPRKRTTAAADPMLPASSAASLLPDGDAREHSIALDAYYRAERRGFAPGSELADWLEAEAEFDATAVRRHSADGDRAPASSPDEFN